MNMNSIFQQQKPSDPKGNQKKRNDTDSKQISEGSTQFN